MKKIFVIFIIILASCQTLNNDRLKSESRLTGFSESSISVYNQVKDRIFQPVVPIVKSLSWTEKYFDLNIRGKIAGLSKAINENVSVHLGLGLGRTVKKINTERGERYLTNESIGVDFAGGITDIANFAVRDLNPLPVRLSFSKKERVKVTRQFDSFEKAVLAKLYNPIYLPLTSKRLIEHFPKNTLVSFPSELGLSVGIGKTISSGSPQLGSFVGVLWAGEFTVNVFKKTDDLALVSIIPAQSIGLNFSINGRDTLEVFGITDQNRLVNINHSIDRWTRNAIEAGLGFDILSLGHTVGKKGERLVLEYEFDLTQKQALEAYDKFFKRTAKIKAGFIPASSVGRFGKIAVADLDELEKVERLQRDKPKSKRAIRRSLRYKDTFDSTSTGGHFGFEPYRANSKKIISAHRLEIDKDSRSKSYLLERFETQNGVNSWIPKRSRNFRYSAAALSEMDPTSGNLGLMGLRFKFVKNDERISDTDFGNFRNSLKSMLGYSWSEYLKIDQMITPPHKKSKNYADDFRSGFEIYFNESFLSDLTLSQNKFPNKNDEKFGLTPKELYEKRVYYALSRTYEEARALYNKPYSSISGVIPTTWERFYNWSRSSMKSSYDAIKNFNFHSGEKAALDKVKAIMMAGDLPEKGPSFLAHSLLRSLKDTSSSSRVLPGFLSHMCSMYRSCKAHINLKFKDNLTPKPYNWKNSKTVKMLDVDKLLGSLELSIRDPDLYYFQ